MAVERTAEVKIDEPVNAVVDLYNTIRLCYALPIGGEDADAGRPGWSSLSPSLQASRLLLQRPD